jgi:hypothetical protein
MADQGAGEKPNDKTHVVFNPLYKTGLTPVVKFNPDRIVTSSLNAAGQPRMIWNPATNAFIPDGPDIVVDNNGNVIVVGT